MDFYTELSNNILNYLTKSDQSYEFARLRIIKKINDKLDKNGDFRCPLKSSSWKSYIKQTELSNIITESELQNLIDESSSWTLSLSKISLVEKTDSLQIYLNRTQAIKTTFERVLEQTDKYGSFHQKDPKTYCVLKQGEFDQTCGLTQYRINLLREISCNLITCCGNRVTDCDGVKLSFVKDRKVPSEKDSIVIFCGNVVETTGLKDFNTSDFYSKREIDMRLIAEHKYGVRVTAMPSWKELFAMLGHASVTIELLQIKPTNTVRINMNDPADSNNKGTSFILYNCARIAAILSKFDEMKTKHELALPPLQNIDLSLLCQTEEWELVYNYILYYPTIIKSCIYDIDNGNINPQYLCSFLFELSSKFSVYYRRVRILTQPRSHLLPTLFARIYLVRCLQIVMHNALKILNIKPITQM